MINDMDNLNLAYVYCYNLYIRQQKDKNQSDIFKILILCAHILF